METPGDNLTFHHEDGADRGIWTRLANSLARFVERRSHENLVVRVSHPEA